MRIITLVFFVVMVAAQWFVPISMISGMENIKRHGTMFKFRTQPIDPTDPFRGSYITLRFQESFFETRQSMWVAGEELFVKLGVRDDGFAFVIGVSRSEPEAGNYFRAKAGNYYNGRIDLDFPFDRFYLEESKAPAAENTYNDSNADDQLKVYAVVYIKDGESYVEDVRIDEKSIIEIVKEGNAKIKD
jgi:hypothetical protein